MAFIREKEEIKTGFQEIEPWSSEIDLQTDFVMVYGLNESLESRMQQYRERGYKVHLMLGCAWGNYKEYLCGRWDGKEHWDECQTDRNGNPILHGVDTPYMVPTRSFIQYLTEHLCTLIDKGITEIYMEEPEFWEAGGYSEAFKKEYLAYYGVDWEPPHTNINAKYRSSRLKAYLYGRLVRHLSRNIKEYGRKTGKEIHFYVATHSLVNYAQWKIMSPESRLLDVDEVDGFIAQVWTGTSGTGNVYEGHYKSRTFETAYLEYGIMQELVKGTDKEVWFLQDPVEDNPEHGWEEYEDKYKKTLTAALFWPDVDHYEVCPWPNRVFKGRYPRKVGLAEGMIPTEDMEGAKNIPDTYATFLASMIQTLGDMTKGENETEKDAVGVFLADSCMYQRTYPDHVEHHGQKINLSGMEDWMNRLIFQKEEERQLLLSMEKMEYAYKECCAFPDWFGLTLPLLKYGLPIQPVYFDHMVRYDEYLRKYRYLILSYEFMKPESEEFHHKLVEWVKQGGTLFYIGKDFDPYNYLQEWWQKFFCDTPAQHLFAEFGMDKEPANGCYRIGEGNVLVWNEVPALLSVNEAIADKYRNWIREGLKMGGYHWKMCNYLSVRRDPYIVIASMQESDMGSVYTKEGLFVDLYEDKYPVVERVLVEPGQEKLLFDLEKIKEDVRIIATAARIENMVCENGQLSIEAKAIDHIQVNMRIRLPGKPEDLCAHTESGKNMELQSVWDEKSRTVLLSYRSNNEKVYITGKLKYES
ncbi:MULTISPECIES: hypothetical protein [Roseburia]|jgi:hypothetical protein|uniref:Uncharacterized protein n=1 Tax=Roseburia intestinalis TaxID=166486 RepID=A0A3R6A5W8_9FIRM|nr:MULTISPECIES: hypothetical protein [Roseburia]RHA68624.1 hypothetical protein DW927_04890 [Roseburia intestinalis]RHG30947.1 hypothetical protein DW264_01525 [Roseburia intestinalis]UMZ00109.1 hypothetical protein H8S51_017690 [Roseburia rectibacter]